MANTAENVGRLFCVDMNKSIMNNKTNYFLLRFKIIMKNKLDWLYNHILLMIIMILGGILCSSLCFAILCTNFDNNELFANIMGFILLPSELFVYLWQDIWNLPPYGDAGFAIIIIVPMVQFFLMGCLLTWLIVHLLKKKKAKKALRDEKTHR